VTDYNGPTIWAGLITTGKSGNRRQRTDIGKYSFVNKIIRLWNRLPAEIIGTLPCKPSVFRKRVRRVINVVNWRESEWIVNYLKSAVNWIEVKWRVYREGYVCLVKWSEVKWGEVQWSEAKVLLKMVCYKCGLTTLETRYCSFSYLHFVLICTVVVLYCFVVCMRECVYEWVL
jgi:hypothetical protein